MADDLQSYIDGLDDTPRNIVSQLLGFTGAVDPTLRGIHAQGTAYGWSELQTELGPAATARLRVVYRALRDAVLAIDPTSDLPDVPG